MSKEPDPFSNIPEEEGLSFFMKFIILLSVCAMIVAVYIHGSGVDLEYRRSSPTTHVSIENLAEKQIDADIGDLLYEEKVKKDPQQVQDFTHVKAEDQDFSPIKEDSENTGEAVFPDMSDSPLPVMEEGGRREDKPILDEFSRDPVLKEYRQPPKVKGDFSKSLPDFRKMDKPQRNTPLNNLAFNHEFNDSYGVIGISKNLGKPWKYFARPAFPKEDSIRIAVVVYGLGRSNKSTIPAINFLPPEVTLSFSPYSDNLDQLVYNARLAGHETLLDLPLQASDYPLSDPGNLGLLTNATVDDNKERLHKIMGNSIAFSGFFSMDGEGFMMSYPSINFLMEELKFRGLLLVNANRQSAISSFSGIPYLRPDVIIDENSFRADIRARLDYAREIAEKEGQVSIAVSAQPIAMLVLGEWLEETLGEKVELVPISYMVK